MRTMIHRDVLPWQAQTHKTKSTKQINTLAGRLRAEEYVVMEDVRLPEFDRNRSIEEKRALVFDGHCRYDVILGSDFLEKAGIDIKYTSKTVE